MSAGTLLEIEDARRTVLAAARPLDSEQVPVGPDALGRVLAEQVSAPHAVPAFDNSAMDGFAVRAAELRGACGREPVALAVVAESRAGAPARRVLEAGEAIAISTGAQLPAGADAVVRVEDTELDGERVRVGTPLRRGQNVRRAGEDVRQGQAVLGSGDELGPAEVGVLASLGRTSARCARRPRVALLVTGDELIAPGARLRPGAVRDSSSRAVSSLVVCAGGELARASLCDDEPERTRAAVAAALRDVDVTVICGGVSVGAHDHVRGALEQLGARQEFWGLALKPGRPTWFGTHGRTLVFGLPGNPVSTMVTFLLLVAPALRALQGAGAERVRATAVMDHAYAKAPGRAHAVRCRLRSARDGWHAEPTGPQDSHVLTSMLGADALAIIPTASAGVNAGERVQIEHLRWWVGNRS